MECCIYRSRLTPFSLGELVVVAKWLQFSLHPPVLGLPTSDYMLDKMPMSYKYTISRALVASCLIWWGAMLMFPSSKLHKLCFCFQLAKCDVYHVSSFALISGFSSWHTHLCADCTVSIIYSRLQRDPGSCILLIGSITNWSFNLENTERKMSSSFPYFQRNKIEAAALLIQVKAIA